jgi:GST-like protein
MTTLHTLFGTKGSGSAIVEAALTMLDLEFRIVDAASWEAGSGLDELMRVNPLGQIPTLQLPDGSILTESAAILIHLGLMHPESGLLPVDAHRRAQMVRGLVYVAANCYAAIGIIDFPERWCAEPDDAMSKRIKAGSTARLHHLWDVFADLFPARPFLNGEQLGALDLMAAVVSKWSGSRAHLAKSRPAFSALLKTIESDPRVAPVFQRHWPAA